MKHAKIIILMMILSSQGLIFSQKRSKGTEVSYTNTMVVNVPQHFQGLLIAPTLCDYKILTESSVTYTYKSDILVSGVLPKDLRQWADEIALQAQSKLISEYQADAIVGLTREISTSTDGKLVAVVKGFPVRYVNFRPAKNEDLWVLEFYKHLDRELIIRPLDRKTETETKTEVVK